MHFPPLYYIDGKNIQMFLFKKTLHVLLIFTALIVEQIIAKLFSNIYLKVYSFFYKNMDLTFCMFCSDLRIIEIRPDDDNHQFIAILLKKKSIEW